ncbi:MAG: type VI secretion system baseplate subunit TssK [Alphaproteobacteria bacterium]|nr:type VI secretion system baseplate subunit TssK [Alphaproteobacteria bacterium]
MRKEKFNSITPAIQWHEGMMISPQHFQQSDLRHHEILAHQLSLMAFYHWGIRSLKLDPIVLPDGLIRVLDMEALMADGLIVHYSADMTDIPPLEIDLKPYKTGLPNQEITVQIAIPEVVPESSPVIGEFPRYYSLEGHNVKDINLEDNVIKIPRLVPKLFLHVGEQPPARCLAFPLVKVGFVDEAFALTDYTSPCFFVEKDTALWESCAGLAQKIREKAAYLSEKWQNQIGTPMLQETSALLRPLLSGLPGFETMIHGDPIHPYKLYQKLCETVGVLAPLRPALLPPILPVYEHNNINACFKPVIELIKQYLNSIEQSFSAFPFQQKERLFYLRFHKAYVQDKIYVGLRAPKGMTETQLEEWMNDAVVASDFAIEAIRGRRITGAERGMLRDEELYELMPSRGVIIFEVTLNPEYIKPDQNLNIFNPADHAEKRPTEIVLYVRKSSDKTENRG